jgi:cytochrome P450
VDLLDEAMIRDPYPVYRRLREEAAVHRTRQGLWLVTRHADAVSLLQHRDCLHWGDESAAVEATAPAGLLRCLRQLAPVPPAPFRSALLEGFAASRLSGLRPELVALADGLLYWPASGRPVPLMAEFAHPYTFGSIGRILGFPPAGLEALGNLAARLDGAYIGLAAGAPASGGGAEFLDGLRRIVEEKRRSPDAGVLSRMISVSDSGTVEAWNEELLLRLLLVILYAGHQNMMNFIGNSLLALVAWPAVWRRLRAYPEEIPAAIPELIRYDSPLQYLLLTAGQPVEIGAKYIQRGETILVGVGAANRDPAVFPDPDQLDPRRDAHRQLGFGWGPFRCLGARLAQLQGAIALERLLRRIPDAGAVEAPRSWRTAPFVQRGPRELRIRVHHD